MNGRLILGDAKMTIRLLAPKEVCRVVGLSRATVDRLAAEGRFPKPIRLTPNRLAFNSVEVDEWIQARLNEGAA
jgi:prophage regulatory protein